ncbi:MULTISPECIES: hypothetical protein [Streptomyces]|uniref:Uncharacterized protein n=1 Tax=Streptomyces pini TaxID=1520580 RepID=A0A1I4KJ70_9ACTN|nr:hypothetical protein [Streptomyces pini]SFL78825.1 hypothetical protein SAMN05192584_12728 [Streptomyces pini]
MVDGPGHAHTRARPTGAATYPSRSRGQARTEIRAHGTHTGGAVVRSPSSTGRPTSRSTNSHGPPFVVGPPHTWQSMRRTARRCRSACTSWYCGLPRPCAMDCRTHSTPRPSRSCAGSPGYAIPSPSAPVRRISGGRRARSRLHEAM